MLFDLTSRGRRSAVKIIYTALAILMGAGFILFGVGTGVGGGGIFDIFGNGGTSVSSQSSAAEKRAHRETVQDPKNAKAWADLTRARYQSAGSGFDNTQRVFTDAGKEKLQSASVAWGRYVALDPPKPDANVALMMANAYSEIGLNQPADAASAMEIVAAARPSAATYGQLAQYAYIANETRKGQLAEAKAIALAPKAQKTLVRKQLANVRKQILQQQVQEAVQNGDATSTPTPPPAKKKK
jgi:hypothetical protein